MPAAAASSTMYCSTGRSTTGNNSFGTAFVAGRKRVARPAAGITAFTARVDVRALSGMGRRLSAAGGQRRTSPAQRAAIAIRVRSAACGSSHRSIPRCSGTRGVASANVSRPAAFAAYSASSATSSTSVPVRAWSGKTATPIDTVIGILSLTGPSGRRARIVNGGLPDRASPIRRAAVSAAVHVGLRQQDDELLAALAERQVDLPDDRADPPRELGQHRVAGPMAEPVVHRLEPVQVEGEHAERPAEAAGPLHLQPQRLPQVAHVAQAGQLVGHREVFGVAKLGDDAVVVVRRPPPRASARGPHRRSSPSAGSRGEPGTAGRDAPAGR